MTFALFLMLPLQPGEVGGAGDDWQELLILYIISFAVSGAWGGERALYAFVRL